MFELDISSCSVDIEFICFISTSCATLLFMVVSFTYHFLRWHLAYAYYLFLGLLFDTRHKNKHTPNQYDAFISYNTHDELWVIQELLPKLEGDQGWRLCLHHRDFEPGKPIIDNITDAIYGSRKTICVISRKYLESEWCSREIQVASFRLFDEQKDVLILVFLEDIPACELSPYYRMRKLLKKQTYLSWPRAQKHAELFWEKLRQALRTGEEDVDIELIYFITTSCATLLFMVVSFTYHFLRWHLAYAYYLFLALLFDTKHKNKHAPSQYDAFISYNTHDEPWVIQELLPKLEGDQGWRLCLHHRDFEPGKPIIDNITDSIYGSRKTICVISRKYLESEWCSKRSSFRLFDEQKDVLILVFLEDIPTRELSPYYRMRKLLKKRTYLSWPRAEEHAELFWEKLRQALRTGEDRGDGLLQLTVEDK
ncbi:hypothetical protein INR49_012102 [Caranx melampygus]|nr:hypothetical protein INR49_012102 [Caranx melampygus]